MDQLEIPTSHGKDISKQVLLRKRSLRAPTSPERDRFEALASHGEDCDNQSMLRKRKPFPPEVRNSDRTSLNTKRPRESTLPLSNWPPVPGAATAPLKVGSSPADNEEGRRKPQFSSLLSSALPRFAPPKPSEGKKAAIESPKGTDLLGAHKAASTFASGLGNQSTVTSSSNEESTLIHSFGRTSEIASETQTPKLISSTQGIIGVGSACKRTGVNDDNQQWAKYSNTYRDKRKSRLSDPRDGEVLTPLSNLFTSLARDIEVKTISESLLSSDSYGNRRGKTDTACVVNSGCSTIEAGMRERARLTADISNSMRQREALSSLVNSSCSRGLQGSSIDPDLCVSSCSESMFSGLYKPYRPMEPSRMKGSVLTLSDGTHATVNEIMADSSVKEEYTGKRSEAFQENFRPQSPPAESSRALEQDLKNCSGPMESKSSSDDSNPDGEGEPEGHAAPTFVLSSGRLSKDQARKLNRRPQTIDDDFDEYFAQLML